MAWRLGGGRWIGGARAFVVISLVCLASVITIASSDPGTSIASAPGHSSGTPVEPVRPVDHLITTLVAGALPVQFGQAHRRFGSGRLVLIGDSITAGLCPQFLTATCVAFPGAWVADVHGDNLADRFVTEAALRQNDTVILSSIGGWHSPGVDDVVILARLEALHQRISHLVHRLIVLVAPYPNFQLCTGPSTPEAKALLGARHDELCATQQAIADLERSWPVTIIPIIGPYVADEEHQTSSARRELARAIRYVL